MSSTIIIEKKICLEPIHLYYNLNDNLLKKTREVCKDECSKETGYILNVNKIVKIKDNYISNVNSSTIFVIDIEIESLIPYLNNIYTDKVCMIFNGGLFMTINDKIKVLIPSNSLEDYIFDSTNKFFKGPKKQIIKENDIIKIKITGIKYSKKNFSCFGEFISRDT
jgi:DNA-directed RNA polymerase subunit E'/Rpb7